MDVIRIDKKIEVSANHWNPEYKVQTKKYVLKAVHDLGLGMENITKNVSINNVYSIKKIMNALKDVLFDN